MEHVMSKLGEVRDLLNAVLPADAADRSSVPCASPRPSVFDLALTRREIEIWRLVGEGLSSKEVGARLHISQRTVEGHRHRLYEKLGVPNVAALVIAGIRYGVIPCPLAQDQADGARQTACLSGCAAPAPTSTAAPRILSPEAFGSPEPRPLGALPNR